MTNRPLSYIRELEKKENRTSNRIPLMGFPLPSNLFSPRLLTLLKITRINGCWGYVCGILPKKKAAKQDRSYHHSNCRKWHSAVYRARPVAMSPCGQCISFFVEQLLFSAEHGLGL